MTIHYYLILLGLSCQSAPNFDKLEIVNAQAPRTIKTSKFIEIPSPDDIPKYLEIDKIVTLETSSDCLISEYGFLHGGFKTLITPNGDFIICDGVGVYHFSPNGKYVRRYSSKGDAPNQYKGLEDIAINDNGELLISDPWSRVLIYNYTTGEFVRSLYLDWRGEPLRQDGILPGPNGGFYIISVKMARSSIDLSPYLIHQFDANGLKVAEGLSCEGLLVPTFTTVTQSYGNRYIIRPLTDLDNSLIETKSNSGKLTVSEIIDFEQPDALSPKSVMASFPDGVFDMSIYTATEQNKMPHYIQDTPEYGTFFCAGPKFECHSYIYSKKSDKGIVIMAPNRRTFPSRFVASDNEYLYLLITRSHIPDGDAQYVDLLTNYILNKYGGSPEGSNPKLIAIRPTF